MGNRYILDLKSKSHAFNLQVRDLVVNHNSATKDLFQHEFYGDLVGLHWNNSECELTFFCGGRFYAEFVSDKLDHIINTLLENDKE